MSTTGIQLGEGVPFYRTKVPPGEGTEPPTLRLVEPAGTIFHQIRTIDDVDAALDLILTTIDELLRGRRFLQCDRLLGNTPVHELPSECLLAFLSVTRPAKDKLHRREKFAVEARAVLARRLGEDEATKVLSGLI